MGILLLAGVLIFSQTGIVLAADDLGGAETVVSQRSGEAQITPETVQTKTNQGAKFAITAPDESGYTKVYAYRVLEQGKEWEEYSDYMISGGTESNSYAPAEITIIPIKANPGAESRTLMVEFDTDGDGTYELSGTIIQLGEDQEESGSTITGVTEASRKVQGGKLVVEYKLTGTALKEDQTEVKVKQGMYAPEEWLYDIAVSGSGTEQTVTITFSPDIAEATYTISFAASGSSGSSEEMTVTVPKEGELGEETQEQTLIKVTASKTEITNTDRTVEFDLEGTGLTEETGVKVLNQFSSPIEVEKKEVTGTGTKQKITLTFPENEFDQTYTVSFWANGDTGDIFKPNNKVETTIQHKVSGGTEKNPVLTAVEPSKQTVTNANRKVAFTLTGTDLTEETVVEVYQKFAPITDKISDIRTVGTGTRQTVTMTLPENAGEENQEYTIRFYPEKAASWDEMLTAAVTVQNDTGVSENAEITGVTAVPAVIGNGGGTVELKVTGTGLTADNWGVTAVAYLEGMMEWPDLQASVAEITADGATLVIPANTMKNQIEYKITVGVRDGSGIKEQAETAVIQAPKADNVSMDPRMVELSDDHTITAIFPEEVSAAETAETALKEKIFIADYGTEANKRALTDEDTVTVSNSQVVIKTKEPITLSSSSALFIKEGALKNADGLILKDISWQITSQPRVSKIALEQEILDSTGGRVTAHLKGSRLGELKEGSIEGKILAAGESRETQIPVSVTYGEEPALTFELPENTADQTQSYLLKVTVNGSPVIEGISGNPAERAVVSVLPAGKNVDDQTLSAMTISGKTEAGSDSDLSEIALTVTQSAGELKAVLHLYGTNLDSGITKLRAIDENGIIWPVYHIGECDGTFRFTSIAYEHGNGATGDGNSQIIEILPPRYAGTNKTYTIQAAIDGKNFLETAVVKLTINNEGVQGETNFTPCGPEDIKEVIVHYVEQGTGKVLAEQDVYRGYSISMVQGFEIAPKAIEGYKVVKSPTIDPDNDYVLEGREYTYEYQRIASGGEPGDDGQNPGDSSGSGQGQGQGGMTAGGEGADTGKAPADSAAKPENTEYTEESPKTGDTNQVLPWMAGMAAALAVIVTNRKKAK